MESRAPRFPSRPIQAIVVFSLLGLIALPAPVYAQDGGSSLQAAVARLEWRNIGPTIMATVPSSRRYYPRVQCRARHLREVEGEVGGTGLVPVSPSVPLAHGRGRVK